VSDKKQEPQALAFIANLPPEARKDATAVRIEAITQGANLYALPVVKP